MQAQPLTNIMRLNVALVLALPVLLFLPWMSYAGTLEQQIDLSPRYFANGNNNTSDVALGYQLKYHHYTADDDLLVLTLDAFASSEDDGRDHLNVEELYWNKQADNHELKVGIDTVFWGVAESTNVVDIINQKNNLTADSKDKLGELMARYSYFSGNSSLDVFYLPKFRPQQFIKATHRGGMAIGNTTYEHKHKQAVALRYQQIIDNLDIGLSYFNGTGRLPQLSPNNGVFDVYYPTLQQFGFDAQLTQESILWKLEYANKQLGNNHEYAAVYGFEYLTLSSWNVNFLLEHNKNSQKTQVLQNDVLFGIRLELNDKQSSEALIGLNYDLDHHSKIFNIKGSRRLNNSTKLTFEANYLTANTADTVLQNSQDDDSLSMTLSYYF